MCRCVVEYVQDDVKLLVGKI